MNQQNNSLLSLAEYTSIAKKIIYRYSKNRRKIRDYDELLCDIISILIKSDLSYDTVYNIPLYVYRNHNINRYLSNYFKKKYNKNKFIYEYAKICKYYYIEDFDQKSNLEENKKNVNYLINNAQLTPKQKEHVVLFMQGYTQKEISAKFGTSRQDSQQILQRSFEKMKTLSGV